MATESASGFRFRAAPAEADGPATHAPATDAPATRRPAVADRMPGWVFWVALGWLAVTLAVFIVYETVPGFRHAFPTKLGPYIPVTVPWFGALGGCLVSLAEIGRASWRERV